LSVYTLSNVKEERVEREQVGRIDDEYARHWINNWWRRKKKEKVNG
jgi:hypothetical protein